MSRRAAWTLIALFAWTVWVWITFMWIIAHQDHPDSFLVVHGVIAAGSIAFGAAAGSIGYRALRSGRPARVPPAQEIPAEMPDREALGSR